MIPEKLPSTLVSRGYDAKRHNEKYIMPFVISKEKNTHILGKKFENLEPGTKLTIIKSIITDETYYTECLVNQKKYVIPNSKINKPPHLIKNPGLNGFRAENELVQKLKKHQLMSSTAIIAGSTAGNDFYLGGFRGETKLNIKAKFGELGFAHNPLDGFHISKRSMNNRQYMVDIVTRLKVDNKPILKFLNKKYPKFNRKKDRIPSFNIDCGTSLDSVYAYLKDHHCDIIHVFSHGTFRATKYKDRTGIGFPGLRGRGYFKFEYCPGNILGVKFYLRFLEKSPLDLMVDEHLKEIKKETEMKLLREVLKNTYAPHLILVDESAMNDLSKNKSKKEMSKHIDHISDSLIRDGADGFDTIEGALRKTNDFLRGKNPDKFSISSKYDGSPSLVWGCDPKTGQFFVSTKSYFNKNPKINYSDEDIKANHGSSIGLSKKLRASLKHLPEITPKVGIFQGDLLWIPGDIQDDGKKVSFQPNTLTYHVPSDSEEGEKIKKSKIGIAPHTKYKDVGGGEMRAHFNNPIHKLKKSENVHMVDPKVTGPFHYSPDEQKKFEEHLKQARKYHQELVKYNGYPLLQDHEALLLAYINDSVKGKKNLDASSYAAFVQTRYQKKMESLKLPKTQSKMKNTINQELNKIVGSKNVLDNLFKCHKQIQLAKHILINSLSKSVPYGHSIQGKPSKPEGFVVVYNGRPIKLVDRQHFSAANFDWNQKVNPEDNPHVISWARMNPPSEGHKKVIDKGEEVANRTGAKHQVYTTRTHDTKKNPLGPEDKLKWLKTLFPGKNIALADKNAPTMLAQIRHLNNSGVKDLTIVAGADRLEHFQKILNQYNGPGDNKLFNFKRIRVISAGDRDENSKGVEGTSGSKMRDAAKKGDFKSFVLGLPKGTSSDQQQKLFHDVQNSMKVLSVDSKPKSKTKSLHHIVAGYLSHSKK